jgi:hypothetical protein
MPEVVVREMGVTQPAAGIAEGFLGAVTSILFPDRLEKIEHLRSLSERKQMTELEPLMRDQRKDGRSR